LWLLLLLLLLLLPVLFLNSYDICKVGSKIFGDSTGVARLELSPRVHCQWHSAKVFEHCGRST